MIGLLRSSPCGAFLIIVHHLIISITVQDIYFFPYTLFTAPYLTSFTAKFFSVFTSIKLNGLSGTNSAVITFGPSSTNNSTDDTTKIRVIFILFESVRRGAYAIVANSILQSVFPD